MTAAEETAAIREIRIMTFEILGIRFGMDMDQMDGMKKPDTAGRRHCHSVRFHEMLPFSPQIIDEFQTDGDPDRKPDAPKDFPYRRPMIILVKDQEEETGMIIEHPDDIDILVPVKNILPMPKLIKAACPRSPVWGAVHGKDGLILLVDAYRLLKNA